MIYLIHPTKEERFWSKVKIGKLNECWIWQGGKDTYGYGVFHYLGEQHAHRVMFRLKIGEILPGNLIMHTCDNPPCVNPNHILQGTPADNMQDKVNKGRAKGAKHFGEQNGIAKLTDQQVIELKNLFATGKYTRKELADIFGYSYGGIVDILNGKRRAQTF